MKKLLMLSVLMPVVALANTETINGISWTFSVHDGQAVIGSDSADVSAIPSGTSGAITVPSKLGDCPVMGIGKGAFKYCTRVKSVTIPPGVTSIGDFAFYYCDSLTEVKIPSSVTSIGVCAFCGCNSLSSVALPPGLTIIEESLFSGCSKLASVTIPSGVTSVGRSAFMGCTALASVAIPSGVTRIENGAFERCSALASVTISEDVMRIEDNAFYGCYALRSVALPSTLSHLGDCAFEYSGLEAVAIPEGVTRIGEYAFEGCKNLTQLSLPASLTSIGNGAFASCDALGPGEGIVIRDGWVLKTNDKTLSNVTLPTGLRGIGANAFGGCDSLWAVTIPEGVISIGDAAFAYCPNLVTINIPASVREIGFSAFEGCGRLGAGEGVVVRNGWVLKSDDACPADVILHPGTRGIAGGAFESRKNLKAVTIPDGVTSIGALAFYDCASLTAIEIPEGVPRIGRQTFEGCEALCSVELPSSVMEIGYRAFFNCNSLASVTIPSNVTEVGYSAFQYCGALKSVTIPDGVTSIGWGAFGECGALESVSISASVTRIGNDAFKYCNALKTVHVQHGGDVEFVKKMLVRSGFDVDGVTFVCVDSDNPDIVCELAEEYRTKADVGQIPVSVINVDEAMTISAKGLPTGMKFTARNVKATKKAAALPANTIYGAPTKSGVYLVVLTAKPTNRKSKTVTLTKTMTVVVRTAGEHVVRADCDAVQGTVKGMGVYAKGKKVVLKAAAAKGWVFNGWSDGEGAVVTQDSSWTFTMPDEDVGVVARFVTVAEDKASIKLSIMADGTDIVRELAVAVRQGMYVEWPVAASALSATTVKVSGLPSGLKFTAKDVKATKTSAAVPANTIYGTPKTASKIDKKGNVVPSKVKVTVTTAGKSKQEYVLNVTVRGIPAEGTFDGGGENGLATLTVAKTGKISGKWLADGKTWTLSAAGFDTWDEDDRMTATLTAKSGKEVRAWGLVYEDGRVVGLSAPVREDAGGTVLFEVWKNEWKVEPWKTLAKVLKGTKMQVGEILLTVGANGAVTAKGTFVTGYDEKRQKDITFSASCSTVLIPVEGSTTAFAVYLYFPPKAGKFGGFSDRVILHLD